MICRSSHWTALCPTLIDIPHTMISPQPYLRPTVFVPHLASSGLIGLNGIIIVALNARGFLSSPRMPPSPHIHRLCLIMTGTSLIPAILFPYSSDAGTICPRVLSAPLPCISTPFLYSYDAPPFSILPYTRPQFESLPAAKFDVALSVSSQLRAPSPRPYTSRRVTFTTPRMRSHLHPLCNRQRGSEWVRFIVSELEMRKRASLGLESGPAYLVHIAFSRFSLSK